ncbi:poly(U)-specific 3'-to-5' RNA exonuclease [Dissophora globulifera]|uniref:U6 snRNA phosphodiesterase n=1 Tax=Dissophora globulifera TaxID=979702 RepID=A0A9P6ULT5_9FUNG|nr:poly(U)-specific 3'-to-5' RNA exonuclease [Dissophora globulifera]
MPLVDYGSSSEEDDGALDTKRPAVEGTAAKRALESEAQVVPPKRTKVALPPLPPSLTSLFKDKERPQDNPERHQGRVRARPHVDGSWPVHVYLEVKLSSELFDIVTTLIESARRSASSTISLLQSIESQRNKSSIPKEAKTAEDSVELHISLTRPLYLQELHLGRFTTDVRDAFKNRKRQVQGVSFANDDKTRSFLSLRVGSGHAELESLVAEMDIIAKRFGQPPFYDDPQFHASFAWALGGDTLTAATIQAMTELDEGEELGRDLRHSAVTVRRVAWKTGHKVGSVALMQ